MTKFKEYQAHVRKRLAETIKIVPIPEDLHGASTPYTAFALKMALIAKERGTWPWKQKVLNNNGVPKDLPSSLKSFAEGRAGMNTPNLTLIEMACLEYEIQGRIAKGERAGVPFTGMTELPEPVPPLSEVMSFAEPDAELAAIQVVNDTLADLEPAARVRVLAWASAKYNVAAA